MIVKVTILMNNDETKNFRQSHAACERPVQEAVPEADLHYAVLDYLEKGNIQTAATLLEADIGKIVTPG